MATEAQTEANRRNSQRSTGPKSEAGKAVASRNSLKFGFFSRHVLLPGEDEQELAAFREGLLARLQPADALERLYAERIVTAGWRLQRALQGEASLFAEWRRNDWIHQAPDVLAYQHPMQDLDRLQKHVAALERGMDKALTELRKLQGNRPEEAEEPEAPEEAAAAEKAAVVQTGDRIAGENANRENEPNSESESAVEARGRARIEIVKTNPIAPLALSGKEEKNLEPSNCENEPNSSAQSTINSGGGAVPAPTPEVT